MCGKNGHKAHQSYKRHGQQKAYEKPSGKVANHMNLVETNDIIAAVVVETNLVENKVDWVLDTGASRHLCSNKDLFHDFKAVAEGKCVYMGNQSVVGVLDKGKILLKLTFGKTLALNIVLYVPSLCINLVSGALLNKTRLKIVLEANKVVLTRNGEYVGKGYLNEDLVVLNITSGITNGSSSFAFAYIAKFVDVWHCRLGHVNIASIKRLKKWNLIPVVNVNEFSKCAICVEAKYAKKPFNSIENRKTILLE